MGRIIIYLSALSVVISVVFFFAQKKADPATNAIGADLEKARAVDIGTTGEGNMPLSAALKSECPECPVIQKIVFKPVKPTALDNISVSLATDKEIKGGEYQYSWFVNGKLVADNNKDVLPAGKFRKSDIVSVNITPYLDSRKGLLAVGPDVIISGSYPSLTMKEGAIKAGKIIEFQLVGIDPDGEKLEFALEDPLISGMTIDRESGKITWRPASIEKGVYKFGASAAKNDGTKTIRVFDLAVRDSAVSGKAVSAQRHLLKLHI
jgi:hypothetical protein